MSAHSLADVALVDEGPVALWLGAERDYYLRERSHTVGRAMQIKGTTRVRTSEVRRSVRVRHDRLRVMLVDDHEVVRSGLRSLLESAGDVVIVAEAATEDDAVALALQSRPDVVVMDVRLAEGTGVEATREIRARLPGTRVMMLTAFVDDEALVASLAAGASGFVLKELRGPDILGSVRAVARGEVLLDREARDAVIARLSRGKHLTQEKLALLSPQEERILEQMATGKTNHEIALELELAEKTVKNYVSNVLMKLDVGRRAEAAAYLARHTGSRG